MRSLLSTLQPNKTGHWNWFKVLRSNAAPPRYRSFLLRDVLPTLLMLVLLGWLTLEVLGWLNS